MNGERKKYKRNTYTHHIMQNKVSTIFPLVSTLSFVFCLYFFFAFYPIFIDYRISSVALFLYAFIVLSFLLLHDHVFLSLSRAPNSFSLSHFYPFLSRALTYLYVFPSFLRYFAFLYNFHTTKWYCLNGFVIEI